MQGGKHNKSLNNRHFIAKWHKGSPTPQLLFFFFFFEERACTCWALTTEPAVMLIDWHAAAGLQGQTVRTRIGQTAASQSGFSASESAGHKLNNVQDRLWVFVLQAVFFFIFYSFNCAGLFFCVKVLLKVNNQQHAHVPTLHEQQIKRLFSSVFASTCKNSVFSSFLMLYLPVHMFARDLRGPNQCLIGSVVNNPGFTTSWWPDC